MAASEQPSEGINVGDSRQSTTVTGANASCAWLFLGTASVSVLISVLIILTLFGRGVDVHLARSTSALIVDIGWFPRHGLYDHPDPGRRHAHRTRIAMLVAAPLGLGAAIYLAEYAQPRSAGCSSRSSRCSPASRASCSASSRSRSSARRSSNDVPRNDAHFNLAAAGSRVGMLITPLVASVAEDAMRAVPRRCARRRTGSAPARGRPSSGSSSRPPSRASWPRSSSAVSRAIGETMVVAIAAGASGGSLYTLDPSSPGQTMTAAMAALAIGSDQVAGRDARLQEPVLRRAAAVRW